MDDDAGKWHSHACILNERSSAMDYKIEVGNLNVGLVAHLGIKFIETTPERVVAELEIREPVCTLNGAIHGGTLMALADTVGAVGTLVSGEKTATAESKTNFFAAARQGKVRAEATPLHKGK